MSLERFYRLLLLSFPADWRARHGDELVATLLVQSRPGRRFPDFGDVADVVGRGLQSRARSSSGFLRCVIAFVIMAGTAGTIYVAVESRIASGAASLATLWLIYMGVALSPGVNFALIGQTATLHSRRDAMYVAAGVTTASTLWMAAALVGLIALAEQAGAVFNLIRISAGLYLIWLGLRKIMHRNTAVPEASGTQRIRSRSRNFAAGFFTNMGNPKAILFFGSLFAAALPSDAGVSLRFAAAGLIIASSIGVHFGLASLLSLESVRAGYERARRWVDPLFGAVFVLFGVRLLRTDP